MSTYQGPSILGLCASKIPSHTGVYQGARALSHAHRKVFSGSQTCSSNKCPRPNCNWPFAPANLPFLQAISETCTTFGIVWNMDKLQPRPLGFRPEAVPHWKWSWISWSHSPRGRVHVMNYLWVIQIVYIVHLRCAYYMHIYVYIWTTHKCMCNYTCLCIYICIYTYACVCVHACTYTYARCIANKSVGC